MDTFLVVSFNSLTGEACISIIVHCWYKIYRANRYPKCTVLWSLLNVECFEYKNKRRLLKIVTCFVTSVLNAVLNHCQDILRRLKRGIKALFCHKNAPLQVQPLLPPYFLSGFFTLIHIYEEMIEELTEFLYIFVY